MSQNVIELNGKRYDALSGAFLGKNAGSAAATAHAAPVAVAAAQHRRPGGRTLDGVIRASRAGAAGPKPAAKKAPASSQAKSAAAHHHVPAAAKAAHAVTHRVLHAERTPVQKGTAPQRSIAPALVTAAKELMAAKQAASKLAAESAPHTTSKTIRRHHPEHAKTLMRRTVHKPEAQLKPAIKPQAPAEVAPVQVSSALAKRSVSKVDPSRLERARAALKHASVQRFAGGAAGLMPATFAVHHSTDVVPIIAVQQPPLSAYSSADSRAPADIFEHALKHARSHEQQPVKRRRQRTRLASLAAAGAAFVILAGFITYLNLPNIQLHVASIEAGFHASMPGYAPTGYALRGGVHHDGGTVSMHFTSGDSSYDVTQQSSNWDSQALLDNTLALSGPHQTLQRNGRTIFVYSTSDSVNAAWVTGNVRYDITGQASLSADQLANIAASM